MKVDDFQLCKDDNVVEFVQFTEGQGLHTKHRDFQPRMFAVDMIGSARQEPLASSAFFNCRDRARMPLQLISMPFFSVWIKPKFRIAQPNNEESSRTKSVELFQLLPGFIQLQAASSEDQSSKCVKPF